MVLHMIQPQNAPIRTIQELDCVRILNAIIPEINGSRCVKVSVNNIMEMHKLANPHLGFQDHDHIVELNHSINQLFRLINTYPLEGIAANKLREINETISSIQLFTSVTFITPYITKKDRTGEESDETYDTYDLNYQYDWFRVRDTKMLIIDLISGLVNVLYLA